jgi:hypothetical protein
MQEIPEMFTYVKIKIMDVHFSLLAGRPAGKVAA